MLKYDCDSGDLFLVGKDVVEGVDMREYSGIERRKVMSQHETRQNRISSGIRNRNIPPPRPLSK